MSLISEQYNQKGGFSLDDTEHAHDSDQAITPEEDRRILRLIDRNLLILMAISYSFQFLDKGALGYTAVLNLPKDLHLTGSDYSWASTVYYFGYLIASYPAGFLIVRSPVGKIISTSMLVWGGILMLTAVCFNFGGLAALRFFLGFAESAIGPGLTILISMWYKRKEQPLRQAAWFLGNTFAVTFGGLLAYGIAHIKTIPAWKTVFLIFGAITVLWSFCLFYLLPDTPMNARFLSPEDRVKAVDRVKENMTGIKTNQWDWKQFFEALTDIQVWMLFLFQISGNIANGGIQPFASLVIKGFGFSTLNTLLIQMILGVFQAIFVVAAAVGATFLKNTRVIIMLGALLIALAGVLLIRQLPEHLLWGRFFGFALTMAYTANFPLSLAMASSNIGGFTKRATVNAMIFIAYCAGNIVGPQLFFEQEAPSYPSAFLAIMVCFGAGIALLISLRAYLMWQNARRDRNTGVVEVLGQEAAHSMALSADTTDKHNPKFRYMY